MKRDGQKNCFIEVLLNNIPLTNRSFIGLRYPIVSLNYVKTKKKQDNFLIYIFRISLLLDFMICLSKVEFNLKYYGSSTILLTN